MTILLYILIAMLSAIMLTAAVVIVFKMGEKELITQYTHKGEGSKNK
jgi:hypothetical protein